MQSSGRLVFHSYTEWHREDTELHRDVMTIIKPLCGPLWDLCETLCNKLNIQNIKKLLVKNRWPLPCHMRIHLHLHHHPNQLCIRYLEKNPLLRSGHQEVHYRNLLFPVVENRNESLCIEWENGE